MRFLLAGLIALVSSQSFAGELPQEIREAIQKIGPVINAPDTAKLLAPLQAVNAACDHDPVMMAPAASKPGNAAAAGRRNKGQSAKNDA